MTRRRRRAGLLTFGWRFGWAAPGLEFWSLKVVSGVLLDGRLAHHALPGRFPFQCSRRCQTGYRATQILFAVLKLPIACQNCKAMATETRQKQLSSFITDGYTTNNLVLITAGRLPWVCQNKLMLHIVPPLMTLFVAHHIQTKRSPTTVHYIANLLYCLCIILFFRE